MITAIDHAAELYDAWRARTNSPPTVRLVLRGGVEFFLSGLVVAPSRSEGFRIVGGEDASFPVIVLAAAEVAAVEFQAVEPDPEPFGFARGG